MYANFLQYEMILNNHRMLIDVIDMFLIGTSFQTISSHEIFMIIFIRRKFQQYIKVIDC